ncbi:prepilin-type N-terminal cleavage/methylation domain-containing protein [Candidatus Gracilibacteria bacterium]|nr:prepilin-type N-terminal cleavage/methylation domain-containing protein [Candidatus Gracilibacteria bacterium]
MKNNSGFTLIEILVGILIFIIVILGGFQALSSLTLGKVKLIEKTNITKDITYFTEKLFDEIKAGGTIDYEEYFNRLVVGNNTSSGYYIKNTGFGNFGSGGSVGSNSYGDNYYYCRSSNGTNMGTGGCYNNNFNTYSNSTLTKPQRYNQYTLQFVDYNSDQNADLGDENGDGKITGDKDDEHLGEGPLVFTGGENIKELYLISGDGKKRTLFRWRWEEDMGNKPPTATCNSTAFGSGCIGTIEILKLEGKDWGVNHNKTSSGAYDGLIDTWIIDPNYGTGTEVIAGATNYNYWQKLFPDTISVSDFKVYLYPNINSKYGWKNLTNSTNINPYVKLSITLEPSWKKRSQMKGPPIKYTINTTINLTDYFSK